MLGALLLAGVVDNDVAKPPLPAGGGTFDGTTQHADARQADSVNRWSHVALTYDGKALRLYENAIQVSSRAETGSILKTTDPLWIGGNHPYGEYFHGLIDEARVYDRGLTPSEIRAEMSTPIRSGRITPAAGLVVRVPPSSSLNLKRAMTLSAWIRPTESQGGVADGPVSPDRRVLHNGRWWRRQQPPRGAR